MQNSYCITVSFWWNMEIETSVSQRSHLQMEGLESLRCLHSRTFRFCNQECHTHIPSPISVAANGSICISSTCSKGFTGNESVKELNVPPAEFINYSELLSHRSVYFLLSWLIFWMPQAYICDVLYLIIFAVLSLKIRLVIHHTYRVLIYKEYWLVQYSSVSILLFNKMPCRTYHIQ